MELERGIHMAFDINVGDALKGAFGLIDDLFTSDEEKQAAKLKMLKLQQEGKLKEFKAQMSVMLAEAKSDDPWTSRARPTFLYVIYVMILFAIPMGILSAFKPEIAIDIAKGMQAWLAAIPEGLWNTFGLGYVGYNVARSADKLGLIKSKKVSK